MSILVRWVWNILKLFLSSGHSPLKLWIHGMACFLCIQAGPSTTHKAHIRQLSAEYGICPPRSLFQPRKNASDYLLLSPIPACYCSQFVLMCCTWSVCSRFFAHIIMRFISCKKGMHGSWLEMALQNVSLGCHCQGLIAKWTLPSFPCMFKFYQILSFFLFLKIRI